VSSWEPFSAPARHAIVRAQHVAQLFGAQSIGTEHIAFALAEGDDDVARLVANALDRDAIRERLGGAVSAPVVEMDFTAGAKGSIEQAFHHAHRLGHDAIRVGHIALGVLDTSDPPPLLAGSDEIRLREALDAAASVPEPA
jgi:ATP-dependent Clp protease ATP-binding subunit ClpA